MPTYRKRFLLFLCFPCLCILLEGDGTLWGQFLLNGPLVSDEATGNVWQQKTADINNDALIDVNDRVTWDEARRYCRSRRLGGFDDWRLPTYAELESIVDYGVHSPAIKKLFSSQNHTYWTASSYQPLQDVIWVISFQFGDDYFFQKNSRHFVRCIRQESTAVTQRNSSVP